MTSHLDRLAVIIKARTPGPWIDIEGYSVNGPVGQVAACRLSNVDRAARDAAFIAALGSCADELLAVVQAVRIDPEAIYGVPEALAALDARLAAVLPEGGAS